MSSDERCGNVGCENQPVDGGYCAECIDISPGILDSNSENDDDETVARARAAFADAVEWFHGQLDRDISDLGLTYINDKGDEKTVETPREWFREVRGWLDTGIDSARLGWAPASRTGLLDHLMREGYDRDAILGTGLFTEDLRPLWQGRFVFPYFDADGQPVYAISRATGDEGGGAVGYDGHPDDGLSGKYAKPAHTKEYARVEEPIFGLDSIKDGQPVLITEGIADAITAQQAGYACISPVTTRFKREDREALREALEDHDVPRVYVVQDAERPSSDLDEDDRLTLTQVGEGLRGALDTAAYLAEHEIDARVAELPRLGLDKVDLDDYLREWATDDEMSTVLAAAKPAQEHTAYDPQDAAIDAADCDRADPLGDSTSDDNHSALFDLDIRDVTGLDRDYRGPSPLGHHGESETYFVIIEKRDVAYDHKYKAAYTPLTYLLADAGERSPDDPNGRLDDSEVFAAWHHAKREGIIPDDDPIPRRALRHVAVDHGHCERDEIEDGWKFPSDAYDAALDTLKEEHGVEPGRDPLTTGWERTPDAVDPTTLDVVLDPETAWRAAWMVSPEDLDTALGLDPTNDGERWQCPRCSGAVDVVRAVAIHHGSIDCCEEPLTDDEYDDAYRRARERFDVSLPEYVDTTTATDNWALVQGAVAQLTHWHLSALDSTVTGFGDNDDVIAEINPTWEESVSEKRVLAFRSGAFYCREHDCTIDPLRIVALEQGIINECDDPLTGEDFTEAYHVAREQYGAPLPEWNTGNPDHVPVLPRADDLLGEFTTDLDALADAREDVENVYAELASDTKNAWLLRALPATGKTTSVVKLASEYPTLYLTARNELQQAVATKADDWGLTSMHLPIFVEDQPNEAAVNEAAALVREEGKDLLRDPEKLVKRIEAPVTIDEEEDDGDPDEEEVDLERASCAVANGEHDEAWQLAVHVARELGHSPQDIHTRDTELFGAELPCHADHECEYKLGWDRATDPDNPKDILIGHYVHGHVEGAKTYVTCEDDQRWIQERVIAIDEFPGDVYESTFGEEFLDHAAWLGKALCADVDDRQDLFETDLWDDDLVRGWLSGRATDDVDALAEVDRRLELMQQLCDALAAIEDLRDSTSESTDDGEDSLAAALADVQALGPGWDTTAITDAHDTLRAAISCADRETQRRIENDVLPALEAAGRAFDDGDSLSATTASDRLGGDLSAMIENAVKAFCEGYDGARGLITGARTAVAGGEEGCRELAIHARDGYAHPLAHLLLHGTIAEGDAATEVPTSAFDFDPDSDTDGTYLKSVQRDRETMLIDRNHHGACVRNPPAFREEHPNPVVGLDATGRERLWELAIGCEVEARDIHDSARERRAFLRDVLNLQVVQTTPHIKTYSGSPTSKNFDGDVALVKEIGKEFAAAQLRQDTLTATTKPGVITTKKVEQEIAGRIENDIAAIDHYGNVTGSNALGELNLGAVLGCRHFGDAVVEKWAALAGETVDRAGHGADLDYDSETANTFLKHMREDQTLQAILRFGRDQEGAVVFAHTAALAESLPVVADGAVVKAFSKSKKAVTRAARQYRGQQFTISDIAPEVDCDKRTVRRALNEFADLGYLEKCETKNGLANSYRTTEEPGVGEADLPDLDEPFGPDDGPEEPDEERRGLPKHPDDLPSSVSSTGFVWVVGTHTGDEPDHRGRRATIPAPESDYSAAPPPG